MEFINNNLDIIFALVIVVAVIGIAIYFFRKLPTTEQLVKVREWLLLGVTEAEKALGGGTGKLKLRWVYDRFIERFPFISHLISFSTFSDLVDDALEEMREMLENNDAVEEYVTS